MRYTKELLEPIVKNSRCVAEVQRKMGCKPTGSIHTLIRDRIRQYGLDTSHFQSRGSDISPDPRNTIKGWEDILVYNRRNGKREKIRILRRALIQSGVEERCSICDSHPEWRGQFLRLEIDHISGDKLDNRKENIRFLCPNCHSQTENYGSQPKAPKKEEVPWGFYERTEDFKKSLRKVDHKAVRNRYLEIGVYAKVGEEFGISGTWVKKIVFEK